MNSQDKGLKIGEATLDGLSNFRFNRLGGVDADAIINGESVPATLTNDQVELITDDVIAEFDSASYGAAVEKSELKATGLNFNGVNISLNESNQNGLAAIKTALDMAEKIGVDAFPINFSAETKSGVKSAAINDMSEFNDLFVQFFVARQQFFK